MKQDKGSFHFAKLLYKTDPWYSHNISLWPHAPCAPRLPYCC